MKVLVLLALVAAVRGAALHYAPAATVIETGESAQFRKEDNLGNYDFGYKEDHTSGGTFRREVGDAHGNVAGSYGLRDADGRIRVVNYIANDDGFHADIKTNEPGVEPSNPADATINKAAPLVVAASAPIIAAPAPVIVPAPVPVAVKSFHSFVAPLAVKSSGFVGPVAIPAPDAVEHIAVPAAKSTLLETVAPVAYQFPAPAAIPVAKSSLAVAEAAPVVHTFPAAPIVPVVKSSAVAIAEPAPIVHAFPAPAAVAVAKTSVAVAEHSPIAYTFPAPAAVPVAKSSVSVVETAPVAYNFPQPAAVPIAKSSLVPTSQFAYSTHVINRAPIAYTGHYGYPYNPGYYSLYSPLVSSLAGPVLRFNNIAYPGYSVVKK